MTATESVGNIALADTHIYEVASIVLYGDPSFVKDLSWDQGTANNTSFFPRQDSAACDPVADQRKDNWIPTCSDAVVGCVSQHKLIKKISCLVLRLQ